MKPESEWIKINVPSFIDKSLFDKAQKQLKINYELCQRNTKNEYLLSHKVYCICGERRTGEGPKRGKHLYYRCIGRVKSFPLPAKCSEKAINARIADEMVWQKIRELMSSPELLLKQAERWLNSLADTPTSISAINVAETEKEITTLKRQYERFTQAYAEEILTIEQLTLHVNPLKEKIAILNEQLRQVQVDSGMATGTHVSKDGQRDKGGNLDKYN